MSSLDQLAFHAPRSEAAVDLVQLVDAKAELEAKLDRLDREQREAADTLAKRSAELTELEKRALVR